MSEDVRDRLPKRWPDRLSDWVLPPPAARMAGDIEPVRVFDTAEAALAFLALLPPAAARSRSASREA